MRNFFQCRPTEIGLVFVNLRNNIYGTSSVTNTDNFEKTLRIFRPTEIFYSASPTHNISQAYV